jgi:multicomponent Na+:H+ antiporter subunit B
MIGRYRGHVVRVTSVLIAPFIMLFGVYVVVHGHYGPGGGFAGGVLPAVGIILLRLTADPALVYRRFPRELGVISAAVGMGLFVLIGLGSVAAGGMFLDYAELGPAGMAVSQVRYLGILAVELAVGLAVFGTLLVIFDALAVQDEQEGP